ncbi:MAG: peptide MFS transporter [Deltaproteobacteria bacterium]|nr:peptide MFS transporter [Deltaproteobacteria bacterium]
MADRDRAFFGHPLGLANLFFTELWERFSYYGMRAFLIFYLAAPPELGGQGMFDKITKDPSPAAGAIVGMFGASVYLLGLPGGWIADRFLGQRKAVFVGGCGIAVGNAVLAIPGIGDFFYLGLVLIAMGTGFLKPNISSLVGQLYKPGDARRDGGYTIYYMGINIGAFFAPLACGYLAQSAGFRNILVNNGLDPNLSWNFAFGLAALGMVGGLIQFTFGQRWLGEAGKHPTVPTDPAEASRDVRILQAIIGAIVVIGLVVVFAKPSKAMITETMGIGLLIGSVALFYGLYRSARNAAEKRGILAMIPLYIGAIGFFAIFEQAPTTLNIFADSLTQPVVLGFEVPSAWYQSVNAVFIVILAPVFAYLWVVLARKGKEPSSVNKFAIGMVLLAFSFLVMLPAGDARPVVTKVLEEGGPPVITDPGHLVSGGYLIGLYFFYTIAELCISPVGLSSMSKLAPARLGGMVMGIWFLGTAIGIYLAGRATSISSGSGFEFLFGFLFVCSLILAGGLFVIAPKIKRMMGKDADASAPADHSEKVGPEPLPGAKATIKKDD